MLSYRKVAMVGVSLLSLATPAMAQDAPAGEDEAVGTTEIIVEARRKDESIQDVPFVVNAVTSEDLEKLNVKEFKDVANLVPGLSLTPSANGIGPQASLRGVAYDGNASGNNGTIEFYMNDAPISAGVLFTSMFDIGQIEVLRGPQGTLRGRASPSGSITITTKKPVLDQAGGYMAGSINTVGGWNVNGAINVPIVENMLGIRLAGVLDENEANRVTSINSTVQPFSKTKGGRVSVLFQPVDNLRLSGSYTVIDLKSTVFDQVESANFADSTLAAAPTAIGPFDRQAVAYAPRVNNALFKIWNWQAEFKFAGQKLNYVGAVTKQKYFAFQPNDPGAFFGAGYSSTLQNGAQSTNTQANQKSHEIRLSSDERLLGIFDYVVGFLYNRLDSPTNLTSQTPLFSGFLAPNRFLFLNNTPVVRGGFSKERSYFGNLTAHIGENLEVSGGIRHIKYHSEGFLTVSGATIAAATENRDLSATIWSGALKYRFNDNIMAYVSAGSSWRPGSATNPIILRDVTNPTTTLAALYFPADEKSKSYEAGIKTDWMDKKLRLNVTYYHQDFDNFAYSARGVFFGGRNSSGADAVFTAAPAIAVGVPVKVNGVEAELAFVPSSNFSFSATASYSLSKIQNAAIPCNDYFPQDGSPDTVGTVPTYAQLNASTGGANIAFCNSNARAGLGAPFVATAQAEYSLPLGDNAAGYLRGFVNYQGKSQNDATNRFDDIDAYALVNLYAGVRDPNGAWEVGAFVKNLFDVERVTSRSASPATASYVALTPGPVSTTGVSAYRSITVTAPREFGIQAKFSFGSR